MLDQLQPLTDTLAPGEIQVIAMSEAEPGDGFLRAYGLRLCFRASRFVGTGQIEFAVVSKVQVIGNGQLAWIIIPHYREQNHLAGGLRLLAL